MDAVKAPLAARLLLFVAASALPSPVAAQPREAPSTVEFRNDLPPRYCVERVRISVDGYVWVDGPVATVAPGMHDVTVVVEVRLCDGKLRRRTARFEARSSERVRAAPGRIVLAMAVEASERARRAGRRVEILWR